MIKTLPPTLRPREKLLAQGAGSLADAELLAVLLRTGVKGEGVLALAHRLLDHSGGLSALLQQGTGGLTRLKGLGPARRAELGAVMELARRSLNQGLREEPVFATPQRVKEYLQLHLAHQPHEVFCALFLDAQHRLIHMEDLFRGTLTHTSVYPREVVKRALWHNAGALVVAHNHPSGVAEPSSADEHLTRVLKDALSLVEVRLLDHFIVTPQQVTSLAERGWA